MKVQQQWITTNMRFPVDLYTDLKIEAAISRQSVTTLIHQKLRKTQVKTKQKNAVEIIKDLEKLARKNSKHFKGSLSDAVREMRYEQ